MKLKYITFVFENCDRITIDGKYVGDFLVDNLHTYIKRIACNSIDKIEVVKTFMIEINKDANVERYEFNQTHREDFRQMTFGRFMECDITAIEFELEDEYAEDGQLPYTEYYNYYVDWNNNDEYYNEIQNNHISKDGHLYIVISRDNSIGDFFDLETINDSDYADFHWEVCHT